MTIDELIDQLEAIKRLHGGDMECHVTYGGEYSEVAEVRFDTTTGVAIAEIQLDAMMLRRELHV